MDPGQATRSVHRSKPFVRAGTVAAQGRLTARRADGVCQIICRMIDDWKAAQ